MRARARRRAAARAAARCHEARLPRAGGHVHATRRCSRRPRGRRAEAGRRSPTMRETCWPCRTARSTRALVPIENSLEGGGQRDARHARARRAADVRDRRRGRCCRSALPDRAGRRGARGRDRDRHLAPAGRSAQCARFLRERLPRRGACCRGLDRRGGAQRGRGRRRAVARRSARALAAELYGCDGAARRASRTSPATQTRFVWLAPRARAPRRRRRRTARRRRRRSSSGAPATSAPGWLVRCLSRARLPRHQPDADRVAAAASGGSATTCSSSTSRAARTTRRSPRRSTACARHCEQVRVLGSYRRPPDRRRAQRRPPATVAARPAGTVPALDSRSMTHVSATTPSGVRVARRAPATRT